MTELRSRPRKGSEPEGPGKGKPWIAAPHTFLTSSAYVRSLLATNTALVGVDLDGRWNSTPNEEVLSLVITSLVARQFGQALITAADMADKEWDEYQ